MSAVTLLEPRRLEGRSPASARPRTRFAAPPARSAGDDPPSLGLLAQLPADLRELLTLIAQRGLTHRQAAVLRGVSAGTISRQLSRLRMRLQDPVVRAVELAGAQLDPATRQLAIDRFLLGFSVRRLLLEHRLSRHALMCQLSQLRGWARATLRAHQEQLRSTERPADDDS